MTYHITIACAKGTSQLCEIEAKQLGLSHHKTTATVVHGQGDLACVYRLCLWLRTASRVLVELANARVNNADAIYQAAKSIEWEDTFAPESRFLVRFSGTGSGIRDTQFGALTVKDAIVDRFREAGLARPNVDKDHPDLKIDAHLHKGNLSIALDVSGAIHQRGYRSAHGAAPIRENLAAAMILRSGWTGETALVDPVCGSATLLIEAAWLAADIAPALQRQSFGFEHWFEHVPKQWQRLVDEAKARAEQGLAKLNVPIIGYEADSPTLKLANDNIERAGLTGKIILHHGALSHFRYQPTWGEAGLLACNPPYGARLGDVRTIGALYERLGQAFKAFPSGWRLAVVSGLDETPRHLHLSADKTYSLPNGPIDAKVYLFVREDKNIERKAKTAKAAEPAEDIVLDGEVLMFANRLKKNLKTLGKTAKKRDIFAYRLYDADIPEYGLAVDVYEDIERGQHLHVQCYDAPWSVSEEMVNKRNNDAIKALTAVLGVPRHKIFIKKRERQKGRSQYDRQTPAKANVSVAIANEKTANAGKRGQLRVREGRGVFAINLADYLDTGLFLDHRPMRERIAATAKGKRVLNLFCYTSSVGVHAALGGAASTTNVDLSQNYLDWSKRNYHLNGIAGLDEQHHFIKADVMAWLADDDGQYEVIFCDPPTFSNTKKTGRVFDVQSAHVDLIERCMNRLAKGGVLYFSNNFRKFILAKGLTERYAVKQLSDSIDFDFKRRNNIHRVWAFREKSN
ncbi:MAG: bifunctional 23S rRNA (guanine(2069)-N(7))-methyltransferase RlmK/23S rRNA (guanine(2445)-N(2))-methyltransferase RlmL [Gammaproteobacteria bacterium]|nr:MAG: bifunctional 23S rRNA (guanine(2069)-N(7))-methyltransferase RlmK/23S rRNA (guanine(2445)-N(2))-methyltransferase RlmL [Gammaproteobacteria bacterium]